MFQHQNVLKEIEELIEILPYQTMELRIELPDETLILQKDKKRKIGFDVSQKSET